MCCFLMPKESSFQCQDGLLLHPRQDVGVNSHGEGRAYWRAGESSWGYVHVYPSGALPDKVITWIDAARNFVAGSVVGDDEDEATDS